MIEEEDDSEKKKEDSTPPNAPEVEKKEVCYSSSCLGDGNCYSPSCLALVEKKETEVEKKEAEKKSFSLPLDDASDDWMLDDDVGSMTMEDEEEPKSSKDEHANVEDKKPQSDEPVSKQEAPVSKPCTEEAAVPKIVSSTEEKPAAPKEEAQPQKKSKKNKSKKK